MELEKSDGLMAELDTIHEEVVFEKSVVKKK